MNCFVTKEFINLLATAMKYNKILEELYLGDNDLSSSDGPPIGAMLTYNTTLQLLDLRNNQIKVNFLVSLFCHFCLYALVH